MHLTQFLAVAALFVTTVSATSDGTTNCRLTVAGGEYIGNKAKTRLGKTCKNWESTKYNKASDFLDRQTDHNYCRNPVTDISAEMPWCYTTDASTSWEYCNINQCKTHIGCRISATSRAYVGKMFATKSGRTCKKWTDTSEDASGFTDGKTDHNYCRSVGADTPWCYTTDPAKDKEDCDIPICKSDGSSPIQGADLDAVTSFAYFSDSLAGGSAAIASIQSALQDTASASMKKFPDIFKNLGTLSSSLGVMGTAVALFLTFLPKDPSAELLAIQNGFAVMENKIDSLDTKLADAKNLIVLTTKVQTYVDDANLIKHADTVFNEATVAMLEVDCNEKFACIRDRTTVLHKVKDKLNVRMQLTSIINGLVTGTDFGGSILEEHVKTYKCDLAKLTAFTGGVLNLAIKAQNPILLYNRIAGTRTTQEVLDEWENLVFSLRTKLETEKNKCMTNLDTYIKADVEDGKYMADSYDNKGAMNALSGVLAARYPWLDWSVLVIKNARDEEYIKAKCQFKSIFTSGATLKRYICVGASERGSTFSKKSTISSGLKGKITKTTRPFGLLTGVRKKWHAGGVFDGLKDTQFFKDNEAWIETWAIVANDGVDAKATSSSADSWYYDTDLKTFYEDNDSDETIDKHEYTMGIKVMSDGRKAMGTCSLTCSGHGTCIRLPHTSGEDCSCTGSWTGSDCKEPYDTTKAVTVDESMAETFKDLKVSTLADVMYEFRLMNLELKSIKDMVAKL